jgi:hypothetical protein
MPYPNISAPEGCEREAKSDGGMFDSRRRLIASSDVSEWRSHACEPDTI